MKKFKYDIDDCQIVCTSCVDEPATEENFDFFNKHSFAVKGNHVVGPLVVADKPIYRNSPDIGEYEIVFTKDVCKHLLRKMFQDPTSLQFSLDHDGVDVSKGVDLQGLFQVSEALPYKDLSEGSIVGCFEVNDKKLLESIRKRSGFSVEVQYDKLVPIVDEALEAFLSL